MIDASLISAYKKILQKDPNREFASFYCTYTPPSPPSKDLSDNFFLMTTPIVHRQPLLLTQMEKHDKHMAKGISLNWIEHFHRVRRCITNRCNTRHEELKYPRVDAFLMFHSLVKRQEHLMNNNFCTEVIRNSAP